MKLRVRLIQLEVQGLGCPLCTSSPPSHMAPLFTLHWVLSSSLFIHDGYKIFFNLFCISLKNGQRGGGVKKTGNSQYAFSYRKRPVLNSEAGLPAATSLSLSHLPDLVI